MPNHEHDEQTIYLELAQVPRNERQIVFNAGQTTKLIELDLGLVEEIEIFQISSSQTKGSRVGSREVLNTDVAQVAVIDSEALAKRISNINDANIVAAAIYIVADEVRTTSLDVRIKKVNYYIDLGHRNEADESLPELAKMLEQHQKQHNAATRFINAFKEQYGAELHTPEQDDTARPKPARLIGATNHEVTNPVQVQIEHFEKSNQDFLASRQAYQKLIEEMNSAN